MNYNSLDKNNNNKKDMNPMCSPKKFRVVPHTARSIIHEALVWGSGGRVRGRGGVDWESGTGRCKLLHVEWKTSYLYSTENYIQYPEINHNGSKYFKKECVCVCVCVCESAEINTIL